MIIVILYSENHRGFVLVAVIWMLAAMSLLAGFIATQIDAMQRLSFSAEDQRQEKFDRLAIESTTLYLAATRSVSFTGLRTTPFTEGIAQQNGRFDQVSRSVFAPRGDEIRLDGRPYLVRGEYRMNVQDAGSLVSLRSDDMRRLDMLLADYKLGYEERDRLISALADYIDRDDDPRLNGAEKADYLRQGLVPPTNRFLVSPRQLYNVAGWPEYLERMPGFFDEVTIYVADQVNFNTMTPRGLGDFGDLSVSEVNRIVEARNRKGFESLSDVSQVSDVAMLKDPMTMTLIPSRYLQISLARLDERKSFELGVTMTPTSLTAPWEIDYRFTRELLGKQEDASESLAPAAPSVLLR